MYIFQELIHDEIQCTGMTVLKLVHVLVQVVHVRVLN